MQESYGEGLGARRVMRGRPRSVDRVRAGRVFSRESRPRLRDADAVEEGGTGTEENALDPGSLFGSLARSSRAPPGTRAQHHVIAVSRTRTPWLTCRTLPRH